jgi:hypothetical protein
VAGNLFNNDGAGLLFLIILILFILGGEDLF